MGFNIADMVEHTVDAIPDREALVQGDRRLTFRELDDRVNRLGHHLADAGLSRGDHLGIYGRNSIEWVEAMVAAFKIGVVPVNINFRYVEDELRYLFDNADLKALVFQREYAPHVAAVLPDCPTLEHLVMIEDGSGASTDGLDLIAYDDALAAGDPTRDLPERSPDDVWMIYTGGTTGMPKGVMWRQEDIFFSLAGGIDPFTREPVPDEWHHSRNAAENPGQLVFLIIPPLMHGAAQVATMMNLMQGARSVILAHFDPVEVWQVIAREQVNSVLITGDAMGRPLIEALEQLETDDAVPDLSSLVSLSSSAAVFSPAVKERFLERFPDLVITDSIGSTESGMNGLITVGKGNTAMRGGGPTVSPGRDAVVLDEETLEPVEPGSGVVGRLARGGNIPIGYYKDEEKSRSTFVTAADGRRYAIPGDYATVEEDGSITLLGRGSVCINTGGEKVYPEEVEQALKAHPDVFDALVVGVADERWGQRVVAVVQPREGRELDLDAVLGHCREHVAGYKVPREVTIVDEIVRSPAGKPDYPWAKQIAEAARATT